MLTFDANMTPRMCNKNIFQKRIEISCITDFDIFLTNFAALPYSPECPATSIGFNFMLLLNRHPLALAAVGRHLVAEPVGILIQAQVIGS